MLSQDLAPDPQFVPFYDSESCKKEVTYQDLQPIPSQLGSLNFPYSTSVMDLLQNHMNDNIPWGTSYSWQTKPPEQWNYNELLNWLFNWSEQTGVELSEINMPKYNHMNGQEFSRITQSEFCTLDPKYGNMLYQSIQQEIAQHYCYNSSTVSLDFPNNFVPSNTLPAFKTLSADIYSQILSVGDSDFQGRSPSLSHDSDREDRESTSSSMSTANEKMVLPPTPFLSPAESTESSNDKTSGRRGRPPKGESRSSRNRQGKGNGKLWEFIRDLLLDPATNPSLIRWERPEEGIFKFVQSDRVAKMWGDRKQNPRMTYEKLSRAMRYYYKSQVLLPVFGRRLVYKFGPNATGWRHGPGFH